MDGLDLVPDLVSAFPVLERKTQGASQTPVLVKVIQSLIAHGGQIIY